MVDLDSQEKFVNLDKGNMVGSIKALPEQILQAWDEVKSLTLPEEFSLAQNIVVSGMGGSALGGRVIDSLIVERIRTPVEVFTEFKLPNYVSKNTLVVASSYSGNTQETLESANEAVKKGAMVFCITTGGALAKLAKESKLASYVFEPKQNPSGQPRMALGYSIAALMSFLATTGHIHVSDEEIQEVVRLLRSLVTEWAPEIEEARNLAKSLSQKFFNRIAVLIASEHLVGSAHSFKNQLNENSKTFSCLFDLPELNHHLMEGLKNPGKAKELLHFLLFESNLYTPEVQKRYPLTKEVIEKNGVATSVYKLRSEKKLEQVFEVILLGSFISYYLAIAYGLDPSPIPWVDYFKEKLK